jgi:hypothetical protein
MVEKHCFMSDGHSYVVEMHPGLWYREIKDRTPGTRNHWPKGDGDSFLTQYGLLDRVKGWVEHHPGQPPTA